jgi:hypothetical protein
MSTFKKIALEIAAIFIMLAILMMVMKNGSYSGMMSTITLPEVKTVKYTIDTVGMNPRVYEWDTKSGRHCIAVFRDSSDSAGALQCYKKDNK